jgi:protein-S-isoprenylcysteine O-methyltransferase Ste14
MKHRAGEHPFGDIGQVLLAVLFVSVWASDSFSLQWTTFLSAMVPEYLRLSAFGLLLVLAAFLFRSGHEVVPRKGEASRAVKTDGAFRYVRHPIYLAAILIFLGTAISTFSILSLAVLVAIISFYDYISGYEEKVLEEKFGDEYRRYKNKTGKWLPRLKR